ncbi:hypothetical protein PTKIN_Ptkin07bG0282100 [Pterospermum kingtungense]
MGLHCQILKSGNCLDLFATNILLNVYVKAELLSQAETLFDEMPERNTISFVTLIQGYVHSLRFVEAVGLFARLHREGHELNPFVFTSILKVLVSMECAEMCWNLHACIYKLGHESNAFVGTALIDAYSVSGCVDCASRVFDGIRYKDMVAWTGMIACYAENDLFKEALEVFSRMRLVGFKPNNFTFAGVFKACIGLEAFDVAKGVHGCVLKTCYEHDIYVGVGLLELYTICGNIEDAQQVFEEIPKEDVIPWSFMISRFAQSGRSEEAVNLFSQMRQAFVVPNQFTFASAIQACSSMGDLYLGKQMHCLVLKVGLDINVFVSNALMDVYAKCGRTEESMELFDKSINRNDVSWNTMIVGYVHNRDVEKALNFFVEMLENQVPATEVTYSSILSASASLAALELGTQIHSLSVKTIYDKNTIVGNALIDMYAKCGRIRDAQLVFEMMNEQDEVSWNAMISGYSMHGLSMEALKIFQMMQDRGYKPNSLTFVGVLSACSNSGLLVEGQAYFTSMFQDYGIEPCIEHYSCMVWLLGRSGHLYKALKLIEEIPFEPSVTVWRALLGACAIHNNVELGRLSAQRILEMEPHDEATHVLLSNIYATARRWENVTCIRQSMKKRGMKKEPGLSRIENQGRVHFFCAGDTSHPDMKVMNGILEWLNMRTRKDGFVPNCNAVLLDVENKEKERLLWLHSERLALAFAIFRTSAGSQIRIIKNLRICVDCHAAMKLISKILQRVMEGCRFNPLYEILCDYWFHNTWKDFACDNNLKVGDVCVFELIDHKETSLKSVYFPSRCQFFCVTTSSEIHLSGAVGVMASSQQKGKSPHFFKIILHDTLRNGKLMIPTKFVRKYGNGMSSPIFLNVPTGAIWKVELTKSDGKVWLDSGWQQFSNHYSLEFGHFLVFRYEGNSNFHVLIFDKSTSEIEYSRTSSKYGLYEEFLQQNIEESEDDDSSRRKMRGKSGFPCPWPQKMVRSTNSTIKTKSGLKSEFQVPKVRHSLHPAKKGDKSRQLTADRKVKALERARGAFKSENPFFLVVMQPSYVDQGKRYALVLPTKFVRKHLMQEHSHGILCNSNGKTWTVSFYRRGSGKKLFVSMQTGWGTFVQDNNIQVGDVCAFELINCIEVSFKVAIYKGQNANFHESYAKTDVCPAVKKSAGASYVHVGHMRSLSSHKKAKAFQIACAFRSANPSFVVVLQPSSITSKLSVPAYFARKYFTKNQNEVILVLSNGKSWPVKYHQERVSERPNGKLSTGWREFVLDNNLEVGDVCLFELTEGTITSLKVTIYKNQVELQESSVIKIEIDCASDKGDMSSLQNQHPTEEFLVPKVKENASGEILDDISVSQRKQEEKPAYPCAALEEASEIYRTLQNTKATHDPNQCDVSGCRKNKEKSHLPCPQPSKKLRPDSPDQTGTNLKSKVLPSHISHDDLNSTTIKIQNLEKVEKSRSSTGQSDATEVVGGSVSTEVLSFVQQLTATERANALQRASAFKSIGNPVFMVVMKPSFLYPGYHLSIPLNFVRKVFTMQKGNLTLCDCTGKTWPAEYYRTAENKNPTAQIRSGWQAFARDNHLDVGDVCVFELIKYPEILMKVVIYPVVESASANGSIADLVKTRSLVSDTEPNSRQSRCPSSSREFKDPKMEENENFQSCKMMGTNPSGSIQAKGIKLEKQKKCMNFKSLTKET